MQEGRFWSSKLVSLILWVMLGGALGTIPALITIAAMDWMNFHPNSVAPFMEHGQTFGVFIVLALGIAFFVVLLGLLGMCLSAFGFVWFFSENDRPFFSETEGPVAT